MDQRTGGCAHIPDALVHREPKLLMDAHSSPFKSEGSISNIEHLIMMLLLLPI